MTRHLPALIALIFALATPADVRAQGCSLCRDTTAGSDPKARQGLRRAIPLLGIPAAGVFLGILALAVRTKPEEDQPDIE